MRLYETKGLIVDRKGEGRLLREIMFMLFNTMPFTHKIGGLIEA